MDSPRKGFFIKLLRSRKPNFSPSLISFEKWSQVDHITVTDEEHIEKTEADSFSQRIISFPYSLDF